MRRGVVKVDRTNAEMQEEGGDSDFCQRSLAMDSISSVGSIQALGALNPQSPRPSANPNAAAGATPLSSKSSTPSATPAQVKAAVDAANQALQQSNQGFSFEFDDTLNGMSVKIIDKRTNTVVRLVPSLEMLGTARALKDSSALGALLKSEA
jgi:uncharacterized FlaG/YvyC family protein